MSKRTPEQKAARRRQYAANPEPERKRSRHRYALNPKAKIESVKRWQAENPDKSGIYKRVYRADPERADVCEVCGRSATENRALCWDHDHVVGHFRGWICNNCNSALGFVNDNIEVLEALIVYLKRNGH